MRKSVFTLVTVLSAFFFITSCQKEISFESIDLPPKSDSLLGDWKFVSMDVKSSVIASGSIPGVSVRSEFIADFLTKNNGGTLNIDSFYLNLTDFTYSLDTVAKETFYINNVIDNIDEYDISYDSPPLTVSSEYKAIGADSIFLPSADFINLPADLDVPPVTGFHYRFEGDKLILTAVINVSEVDNSVVPPITILTKATLVITFQKQ